MGYNKAPPGAVSRRGLVRFSSVFPVHLGHRVQKAPHRGRRLGRVEQTAGDGIIPIHRQGLEHGVDVVSRVDGHNNVVAVFTAVEGLQRKLVKYAELYVDPHVPQYAWQTMDLSSYFKDCIGQTIVSIDFSCHCIHRETDFDGKPCSTSYTQPIILINLSNGKTMRFSINHGEVPTGNMVAWFEVDG